MGEDFLVAVVGDTHANMTWMANDVIPYAREKGCRKIVQCGDFGFIWHGAQRDNRLRKLNKLLNAADVDLHFLPGNHEDHDLLLDYSRRAPRTHPDLHYEIKPRIFYTGRWGAWEWAGRRLAAVGGAVSIDRDWRQTHERRTGDKVWWSQERLTADEVALVTQIGEVDVLFTHDAPTAFPETWLKPDLDSTANRQTMTNIGRALTPKLWFHGHYHCSVTYPFRHDRGLCEVRGLACDESSRLDGVAILNLAEAAS